MKNAKERIFELLNEKGLVKYSALQNTRMAFDLIKKITREITEEYKAGLMQARHLEIECKERNDLEFQLQIASDLLIFKMHTNVFYFDVEHKIHENDYIAQDRFRAYCGNIHIYNFLTDSFRYNRLNDLGYLIGRIFINKENHFFIEGKRQLGFLYSDFEGESVSYATIRSIIESAILYTLDFDLLVPPYDKVMKVMVGQMVRKDDKPAIQTGKRVGFKFVKDDIINRNSENTTDDLPDEIRLIDNW